KGGIQGYPGVAVGDEKPPMIVNAQAHGVGQEPALLIPLVEAGQSSRAQATVIPADTGYQSEAKLKQLAEQGLHASLPDNGYRKGAPCYVGPDKPRSNPAPLYNPAA